MGQFKTGNKSGHVGNMVPSTGNIELRAQDSGVDILTLSQGSTAGKYMVFRKESSALSTASTSEVAAFSSIGGWNGGLPAVDVTSSAIAPFTSEDTVTLSAVGQMYFINALTSAMTITLPAPTAGAREFIAENQNTGLLTFKPATTGTIIAGGSLSGDQAVAGASGATIGYGSEWFSDGSYWYVFAFPPSGVKTSTLCASTLVGLVVSS